MPPKTSTVVFSAITLVGLYAFWRYIGKRYKRPLPGYFWDDNGKPIQPICEIDEAMLGQPCSVAVAAAGCFSPYPYSKDVGAVQNQFDKAKYFCCPEGWVNAKRWVGGVETLVCVRP